MHQPSEIILQSPSPGFEQLDMANSYIADKETYDSTISALKKRILAIQQAYYHQHRRVIVVFEGWDASGKGGAIRQLTEKLDPRGFVVHPISAPTEEEQGRHYLYRFQSRLPRAGRIAIFDRSWYGRVLVERVEAFATKQEWQRAFQEINEFERTLTDDGVRIIKLFLHITPEEQAKRFLERLNNPLKRWELTTEDIRNRQKWQQYEQAANEMFARTSTENAPWTLIAGDHKWFARVEVLKTIVEKLEQGVDISPPPIDQAVLHAAKHELGFEE